MLSEISQPSWPSPRTHGAPAQTQHALDMLAFHLQRYLSPAFALTKIESARLFVGHEGSVILPTLVEVSLISASARAASFDYDALCDTSRRGEVIHIEDSKGPGHSELAHPIVSEDGDLQGFLLLNSNDLPSANTLLDLSNRASEAILASRNNTLRMLFEDAIRVPVKDFIYGLLDQLPSYCGVDHSAALILTNNLEAMTLDSMKSAEFEIIAERMFFERAKDNTPERLVGLTMSGEGTHSGLIGRAFEESKKQEEIGLHIFISDEDHNEWHQLGEEESMHRFATRVKRPLERMSILIPLIAIGESNEREMLGFICINYRRPLPISAQTSRLISTFAGQLARRLRRSSLFSLSSRQMLLLEQVRGLFSEVPRTSTCSNKERLENYIAEVTQKIASTTKIPSLSIGYLTGSSPDATLRFVHPWGFTRFDEIELPISTNEDITGTGIAALAFRLERSVILSGGGHREGDENLSFKNFMFVNEESQQIIDARMIDPDALEGTWHRLSDYHKPSREQNYATLAFPLQLGGRTLGVLTIEVDRETNWLWWTGFGSQTFYRLLANELAAALRLMGTPGCW